MWKSISALALGALMVTAVVPALKASDMDRKVTVSFSNPVQIPGMILPAGTYVFRPLSMSPDTVAIMNQDETETLGLESTIPVQNSATPDHVQVRLAERPSNQPEAVTSWFYPGDSTGYQFVYRAGSGSGL